MHLMEKESVSFRFSPKHILAGGTMNDFVSAIRSKSTEKCAEESTRYFKEDWKSLLEILDQMMVHSSFTNRIEEITSVLNRVCMPRKFYHTESASQFTGGGYAEKETVWIQSFKQREYSKV